MQIAKKSLVALLLLAFVCTFATTAVRGRQTRTVASNYVFDGSWPKLPIPNKWTFGGVTGLAVDNDDLILGVALLAQVRIDAL